MDIVPEKGRGEALWVWAGNGAPWLPGGWSISPTAPPVFQYFPQSKLNQPQSQCQEIALPVGATLPTASIQIPTLPAQVANPPSKLRTQDSCRTPAPGSGRVLTKFPGKSGTAPQRVSHLSEGQAYGEIRALLRRSLHTAWGNREEKRTFSKEIKRLCKK